MGLALLSMIFVVCLGPGAGAQCLESDEWPDLGSATYGDDGTGTGGTGIQGEDGTGSGGTGIEGDEGSGSGGTGILGTITGFGSVCVNGLRVHYDDSTPVVRDGRPSSASQLAVGQVVRVATRPGSPLRAQHIAIENALSGPVTRIELERNRIWVMDQPVELSPQTPVFDRMAGRSSSLDGIGAGARVDVSGQRRSDGVVVATRVEWRADEGSDSVTGVAVVVENETVYVGDLRGKLRDGAPAADGSRLTLRGRWNEEARTLEAASVGAASPSASGVERLSLEGFVRPGRRDGDYEVAGVPIDASRLPAASRVLARDSLVEIRGRLDESGRLIAEQVRVRRVPRGRETEGVSEDSRGGGSKSDRSDRSGRSEREERSDRSGSDRVDRPERPERTERPERPERSDRSGPG
jgi:hypothetical protein